MKKKLIVAMLSVLALGLNPAVHAQAAGSGVANSASDESAETSESVPPIIYKTGEADPGNRIFFTLNQGTTVSWLTRIIKQSGRSNFVFRDFLPGLYLNVELHNIKYVTPALRVAAYYPLTSTFNYVPQKPNTPLHYGADLAAEIRFSPINMKYLRVNIGPALHLFYLNSDRWNYLNGGIAAVAGLELPISSRWTLLADAYASLDNGNLGSNRHMEPFDIVYQYQIDLGFRYSKKKRNDTFVLGLFNKQKQESESNSGSDANNETKPLWR